MGIRSCCISQVTSAAAVKRIWTVQTHPQILHGAVGMDGDSVSARGLVWHIPCWSAAGLVTVSTREIRAATRGNNRDKEIHGPLPLPRQIIVQ